MVPEQKLMAGLWCSEVLANLSAYLDGELSDELEKRINEHVQSCDWCARFGGEFRAIVSELRTQLGTPEPLSVAAKRSLWNYLGSPEDWAS